MKKLLAPFFSALRFLTIINVPFWRENWDSNDAAKQFSRSLVYYPLVGLLLGFALACAYWLLREIVPLPLLGGLLIGFWIWLTGALHLDGLADCADGVAASHKDKTLQDRIMKESTVGTMAVITIAVLLLLKYSALISISSECIFSALVVIPVLSRWAVSCMVYIYPYKRASGAAHTLKENKSLYVIIISTIVTLVIAIICFALSGLLLMLAAAATMFLASMFYKSKLGGLSGDTYGATNEIIEAVLLVILAICGFAAIGSV